MPKRSQHTNTNKKNSGKNWEEGFAELNRNAGGIDVGKAEHYVAMPAGRDFKPV